MLLIHCVSQVARILTSEGIPAPDSGCRRHDRGLPHTTSGVWHATTIASIGRDLIDAGFKTCGRRSMGDQLRYSPSGPRALEEADYLSADDDKNMKVVTNPDHQLIRSPSHSPPAMSADEQERLTQTLNDRAGIQRDKPRSRTPELNPLGGRVYDLACTWPMCRAPYSQSFRYVCGLYMQSHAARCDHNTVDGPSAVRFAVASVAQRVLLRPGLLDRLKKRLEEFAHADAIADVAVHEMKALKSRTEQLASELVVVGRNLADRSRGSRGHCVPRPDAARRSCDGAAPRSV